MAVLFSLMCNNLPVLPLNAGDLLSEPQDPWHLCLRWRVALKSSGVREEVLNAMSPPTPTLIAQALWLNRTVKIKSRPPES